MANKIQKFGLLVRKAGEYIIYQLSSNFVQMRDGMTLQQKADEIDGSISTLNTGVDSLEVDVSDLEIRSSAVESRLDNIVGFHDDGKTQTAVSVPSGTGTVIQNFTLDPGKWFIIINMSYGSNKTGYRCAGLYNSATAKMSLGRGVTAHQAISGGATCFTFVRFLDYSTNTAPKKMYIKAYQNSGSKLNVSSSYTAIRVK
jgi:hypothetical protein